MIKKYINGFTKECDKYLIYKNEYIYTYIIEYGFEGENEIYVFRTAGGTRGKIIVDSNHIVKEIKFYKDTVYEKDVEKITKKYIGKPMFLKNEEE